ncbi:MAG: cytochrome c biogenesis protein CcdA [Nitrososphaerota archaeon]|jgi:cytochrome c biogenesis protein CcdA|nr:cytochrome c biogenesis protein CcdA [Nitrososphaerota archaeon]MDG6973581.1 cytochrome c biogenesis protein CcdA [Nitrososphaerota archaeon]MDG6987365.1 cytochrome c biogenesis protein CcdA [Nitrososphaerota archaeon]
MSGEAFLAASVIISFLAGIVALAMPCCFSVLLPSYLASAFKKRTAVLSMTFVFALGVAAILLPIALGVFALSTFIGLNHSLLFVIGGFFMLFLGAASLLGIQLIPMFNPDVNLERTEIPAVFALGVFSGVASSCCAPVLAGILVLTALTSSLFGATLVGAAYVVGMVFPLFVAASLMDRSNAVRRFLQGRMINTGMGTIHSSKLLAGAIFLSMGAVTVALGLLNRMLPTPGSDLFNIYEVVIQNDVEGLLSSPLVAVMLLGAVLLGAGYYARRRFIRVRVEASE